MDIRDDTSLLVGGFGLVGIPENLIRAVRDCGPKSLCVISNEAGLVVVSVPDSTNPQRGLLLVSRMGNEGLVTCCVFVF